MTITEVLILLVIAGLSGSIGSGLAGQQNAGCLGSIALGFIGAMLGLWLARWLHLPEIFSVNVGHERFPVVWAVLGSALFAGVLSYLTRPRGYS